MRRIGLLGTRMLAAAACAVVFAGVAGAAERFEDLFYFRATTTDPGFSAIWELSRSTAAKDQTAGMSVVDINETGTWNNLLRDSWQAPGDASKLATRPSLNVVVGGDGSIVLTSAEGGGLSARLAPPTQASQAAIEGATKIAVQFRRADIERKELKASGWVIQETAVDDFKDSKKIERLALWDAAGNPVYFTMRDDKTYVAARMDSAGTVTTAASSVARWTETATGPSGIKYAAAWTLIVPDWKWQAILKADGMPSVSAGRIVQRVMGTAVGAKGALRITGVSDLRLR